MTTAFLVLSVIIAVPGEVGVSKSGITTFGGGAELDELLGARDEEATAEEEPDEYADEKTDDDTEYSDELSEMPDE